MIGSAKSHTPFATHLAATVGARVLLLDYRLAPEHPAPAAIDDAAAAYAELLASGIEPGDIVFSGDSAGGGLALATIARLRDTLVPLPGAVVLLSPWTDATGDYESMRTKRDEEVILSPELLAHWGGMYAGELAPEDPRISPCFGGLEGFPPIHIQVGTRASCCSTTLVVSPNVPPARVAVSNWWCATTSSTSGLYSAPASCPRRKRRSTASRPSYAAKGRGPRPRRRASNQNAASMTLTSRCTTLATSKRMTLGRLPVSRIQAEAAMRIVRCFFQPDGLGGQPVVEVPAGLDLTEHDRVRESHDQIDLALTAPPVALEHANTRVARTNAQRAVPRARRAPCCADPDHRPCDRLTHVGDVRSLTCKLCFFKLRRGDDAEASVALLFDLGGLPDAVAQVVELGAAHVAPGDQLDRGDHG